jgi:hypothetical protein
MKRRARRATRKLLKRGRRDTFRQFRQCLNLKPINKQEIIATEDGCYVKVEGGKDNDYRNTKLTDNS